MSLILDWVNEQGVKEIEESLIARLEQLLRLAAEQEGVADGEVVLSFVDDEAIRELNRNYRSIDKATDVLSFSMLESGDEEPDIVYEDEDDDAETSADGDDAEGLSDGEEDEAASDDDDDAYVEPLGDIVISVPRAIEQAEEYGHSFEREIGFLFVHGFLHLIGYDHGDEEAERLMFARQEAVLQQAGLVR